jgi:hypothetical protein
LGLRWPADQHAKTPPTRAARESLASTPLAVQRLPVRTAATDAVATQPAQQDWTPPPLKDIQRPARRASDALAAVSNNVSATSLPPPGVRPRMVNSRTFQLDYDLAHSVPGGVRKVELWGTRDGGRRWSSYGLDDDGRSPMTVTVEGEGMYGFCIVVQAASGRLEYPPQSGQRPDTWIGVDLVRPTCRLAEVRQERIEQAEQLLIAWEADDAWLAERPISLSYSQHFTGPWLPIATGLENTGRYTWPLDSRVPDRFFLRLECGIRPATWNCINRPSR